MQSSITSDKPMKVLYLQGTDKQGCTAHFGDVLLRSLKEHGPCEITRFSLPKAGPGFCTGCAACFTRGMEACPHAGQVQPIWESMCGVDLIVLAQPTYVFGPPAQVKALLDHLACRWLVHSPDPRMLNKRVFILSQAVGAGMRRAAKAVKSSFRYLGAARIHTLAFSIVHTKLEHMPLRKRISMEQKLERRASSLRRAHTPAAPSAFARLMFFMMSRGHAFISRRERRQGRPDTYDFLYWQERGWLKGGRPWKGAGEAISLDREG